MIRIAFQGALGAFSEQAAGMLWGSGCELVPVDTFAAVIDAVEAGKVEGGVLPVENSIAGPVHASLAALRRARRIEITGRLALAVRQHLLGVRGATPAGLARVASHPMALAQCGSFLASLPHVAVQEWYDTAGAARDVAVAGDPAFGAIAGRSAAERYGLDLLVSDVHDRADNVTHFIAIGRRP
jgi:prephenate dehydratase